MTQVYAGAKPKKRFAWSYSRLKNFESCPLKHQCYDITKSVVEEQEPGGPLDYGNTVHKALAAAIGKDTPLPTELIYLRPWVYKVRAGPGKLLVEQQYAITAEFAPCAWFSPVAWFRSIGDVVRIDPPVALILDWKTGKIVEDSVQLALMAQCVFCHFPEVSVVRSEFVWLAHECTTSDRFTRDKLVTMWPGLFARVEAMEQAFNTGVYTPKPSGLCVRHCGVTQCEFHGKGSRK